MPKDLNQILTDIRRKNVRSWIDRLKFPHILILWVVVVAIFGVSYYFLSGNSNTLHHVENGENLTSLSDAIYFSFVTATTTGFGDIVPIGKFKLIAIAEVVLGLLLLAIVTSKLVSIKQDVILNEIYEISLGEKINRLRSGLLLFRQNISRIIVKLDEDRIKKREISDIYLYISTLEDALNETHALVGRKGEYRKSIDPVNAELLFSSTIGSLSKLDELLSYSWKSELSFNLIQRCIASTESLFAKVSKSNLLTDKVKKDLISRKKKVLTSIRKHLDVMMQN